MKGDINYFASLAKMTFTDTLLKNPEYRDSISYVIGGAENARTTTGQQNRARIVKDFDR